MNLQVVLSLVERVNRLLSASSQLLLFHVSKMIILMTVRSQEHFHVLVSNGSDSLRVTWISVSSQIVQLECSSSERLSPFLCNMKRLKVGDTFNPFSL